MLWEDVLQVHTKRVRVRVCVVCVCALWLAESAVSHSFTGSGHVVCVCVCVYVLCVCPMAGRVHCFLFSYLIRSRYMCAGACVCVSQSEPMHYDF
jgi:uncharacterized membrane protein YwzB